MYTMTKAMVFCIFALMMAITRASETETKKTDLNLILNNSKSLDSYISCLLDEGECSPDQQHFKDQIPDAISTNCGKCDPVQKEICKASVNFLIEHRKEDWDKLLEKYDPSSKYRESFLEFVKEP